jgi:hypothetical protein
MDRPSRGWPFCSSMLITKVGKAAMLPGIKKRRGRGGTRRARAKPTTAGVPSTRRKLEEAWYFCELMREGTRRMTQQHQREWEIFGFHLSAFLGAAASVTDVLQAEDRQLCARVCQDFEGRLPSEDLALLEWLYDLRVDEVHVTGAEVQRETGTIPITEAIRPQTYFPGWLIAGDGSGLLTRRAIGRFIGRARGGSAAGVRIETADAATQAASGGPISATTVTNAAITAVASGVAAAPPTAVTSAQAAHQIMLSAWNSPLVVEIEQRVKDDLRTKGVTDPADAAEALAHLLAIATLLVSFEGTYAVIWGSQILILQALNGLGTVGAKEEDIRRFYDLAANQNPAAFKDYPFETYVGWLIDTAQLVGRQNGRFVITIRGSEFLAYLMRYRKSIARPN